ncbi:hypothetical protein H2198_005065 [Neophaeococcomyces mojaviensis]|uniref:Uncharacterized protein n=1 Tax=Neophaeococcomyces mojaviensis TaxID=3383035 RepID=A0ACC3A7L8_9EURO|nr:hypothetical protein H2198_005065 [Knufia sp. JES_112]
MGLFHRHHSTESQQHSLYTHGKEPMKAMAISRPLSPPTELIPKGPHLSTPKDQEKSSASQAPYSDPVASQSQIQRQLTPPLTPSRECGTIAESTPLPNLAFIELLQKAQRKSEQDELLEKQEALKAYIAGTGPKPAFLEAELDRSTSQPSGPNTLARANSRLESVPTFTPTKAESRVPAVAPVTPTPSDDAQVSSSDPSQPWSKRGKICLKIRNDLKSLVEETETMTISSLAVGLHDTIMAQINDLLGNNGQTPADEDAATATTATTEPSTDEQGDEEMGGEQEEDDDADI